MQEHADAALPTLLALPVRMMAQGTQAQVSYST